jgi:hypothetical protein
MSRWTVTAERVHAGIWVLEQAELGCVSQCQRLDQVADEMREAISHQSGEPEGDIEVDVRVVGLHPEFESERLTEARAEQLAKEVSRRNALADSRLRKTFAVNVTRDGKWWMVAIPEIDGLTQARNRREVDLMARDYIALALEVGPDSFDIELSGPALA